MKIGIFRSTILPILIGLLGMGLMILSESDLADRVLLGIAETYDSYKSKNQSISNILSEEAYNKDVLFTGRLWLKYINYIAFISPLVIGRVSFARKASKNKQLIERIGKMNRHVFAKGLCDFSTTQIDGGMINIRFYKLSPFKKKLTLMDKDGFYVEQCNAKIPFDTHKVEGVVSKCYNEGNIVYENKDCLAGRYNLTKFQKNSLTNTKFALAIPIYDRNDKVVNVISVDSSSIIDINSSQEGGLGSFCYNFAQSLYNEMPTLF